MNVKKKQHYVWKHYLKPWSQKGQIWCNRNGKTFHTSLENIGQKRYFYKAEKLNDFEINIVKSVIRKRHHSSHTLGMKTLEMYQSTACGDDHLQKNGIEEFHTLVESTAIEVLSFLQKKDLSWLENDLSKSNFSGFIGSQYTRTNRAHTKMVDSLDAVSNNFPEYKDKFDPGKISKVLSLILADTVGNWIHSEGKFYLLENYTDKEFITGDQPVYNLKMKISEDYNFPTSFKLYYPLTPQLALLISDNNKEETDINIYDVINYNDFIKQAALEQIYSSNQESIEN